MLRSVQCKLTVSKNRTIDKGEYKNVLIIMIFRRKKNLRHNLSNYIFIIFFNFNLSGGHLFIKLKTNSFIMIIIGLKKYYI